MSVNTSATADDHGHTSVFGYLMVFVALMVLTLLTVAVSRFDFGVLANALIAVTIASGKTSLVLYFFMHLRESPKIIAIVAVGSFAWLSILFLFTIGDFLVMYGDGATTLPSGLGW